VASHSELSAFRRTFALLIALVVLPSAALSGFGVLAIINERAAVEKKLEDAWSGKLSSVSQRFAEVLAEAKEIPRTDGVELVGPNERRLSEAPFVIKDGRVETRDARLQNILTAMRGSLESQPAVFSAADLQGAVLLVKRTDPNGTVRGAKLSAEALQAVVDDLAHEQDAGEAAVRFELRPTKREVPDGLVGKLVSEVVQARREALSPAALAERVLPPPLDDFRLVALPMGQDPVTQASTRNRAIYVALLLVFYGTLAYGIVYTARSLYREAKLSRLKTDFVSLVSHELRTPLTSVRMFIETLALGRVKEPHQAQQVMEMLLRETERLSDLIERVLDWARIESGRRIYKRETLPVKDVIDAALAAFQTQRLNAAVELEVKVPAELPSVNVDKEAIAGAVLNLLQNAYKYGGDPKRVTVRARPEAKAVAIDVEDYGIGISPRDRKRIFDRFYRVDNLLTRKTEGSGLGLSIASRIVEAHGGRISVRSEVGQGSCFTVHLPKADPKETSA
jgi:signal transduction histidine kinase